MSDCVLISLNVRSVLLNFFCARKYLVNLIEAPFVDSVVNGSNLVAKRPCCSFDFGETLF